MRQCRMHQALLAVGEEAGVVDFSEPLRLRIIQIDWLLPMNYFGTGYWLKAMGGRNQLCLIRIVVPLGVGSVVALSLVSFGLRPMDRWGIYRLIITHSCMRPLSMNIMEQWVLQRILWNFPNDGVVVILFYIWVWNRLLHHLSRGATFSNIRLSIGGISVRMLLKIKVIDKRLTIFSDFIDLHETDLFVTATIYWVTRRSPIRHHEKTCSDMVAVFELLLLRAPFLVELTLFAIILVEQILGVMSSLETHLHCCDLAGVLLRHNYFSSQFLELEIWIFYLNFLIGHQSWLYDGVLLAKMMAVTLEASIALCGVSLFKL